MTHLPPQDDRSALCGVPRSTPVLDLAVALSQAAAAVGFDWSGPEPVFGALRAEIVELEEAVAAADESAIDHELGDVLLAACNLARHLGVNPGGALASATDRFEARFRLMESTASGQGLALRAMDPDELEHRWQQAKTTIREGGGA